MVLVTFGAPRCGNTAFCKQLGRLRHLQRVIHQDDIVRSSCLLCGSALCTHLLVETGCILAVYKTGCAAVHKAVYQHVGAADAPFRIRLQSVVFGDMSVLSLDGHVGDVCVWTTASQHACASCVGQCMCGVRH